MNTSTTEASTNTSIHTPIGVIGQGFIGKNLADDLEARGHEVVRYALEEPYVKNKVAIAACGMVFIAVPTPTTPDGFDCSILEGVLPLVGERHVAVIKSTILPGTTRRLQAQFPTIAIVHVPEFLREKAAREDTEHPLRTIIGIPEQNARYEEIARRLLEVLPESPYSLVCSSEEAELIKYGGNTFLAMKVVYMNLLYDLAQSVGARYETIAEAMAQDPRIGASHMRVIDDSGHPGAVPGRGAGGHCFPKDLAALREVYALLCASDQEGIALLKTLEAKNNALLKASGKDVDLLRGIYGD